MPKQQNSKFSVRGTSGTTSAKEYSIVYTIIAWSIFLSASCATCAPNCKFGFLWFLLVPITDNLRLSLDFQIYS